jgi:hypothetical protein
VRRPGNAPLPLELVNVKWPKSQGVVINMAENSIDRQKVRHDLKIARTKLFEQFSKHPKDGRLAMAIKIIDDQIANCTDWIRTKGKERGKSDSIHCSKALLGGSIS